MKRRIQSFILKNCWTILLYIGIVMIYLINFWIITKSGYRCDDCYSSSIRGVCRITGIPIFKLAYSTIGDWMDMGRFFPFSAYSNIVFYYLSTRFAYKFAIIVMTFVNSLLFGKYVEKLSGSKKLNYLCLILFPILIPLTCEYNSGLYAFHMLAHMVFLWITLSLLMLLKYMESKKIRYNILSGLFLFVALGTYEVAFVLVVAHLITAWIKQKNIKKFIKVIILDVMVYFLIISINIYLRMKVGGSGYDGTAFGFDPELVFDGFVKQLTSAVPLVRNYKLYVQGDGIREFLWLLRHDIRITDIILIILTGIMTVLVVKKVPKAELDLKRNVKWIFLAGASIFMLPAFLVALSGKYQVETQMGMGHLPSYVQSFGFTLIFVFLLYLIYNNLQRVPKIIFVCFASCMLIYMLLVNQFMARATVAGENNLYLHPRDNVEAAIKAGILDEVSSRDELLVSTDYVVDTLGPMVFYTNIANRIISATPAIGYDKNPLTGNEYSTYSYANEDSGYVILGKCKELVVNQSKTEIKRIAIDNAIIYLQGGFENADYISVLAAPGDADEYVNMKFNVKNLTVINHTNDGTLYKIPYDGKIEISSVYFN